MWSTISTACDLRCKSQGLYDFRNHVLLPLGNRFVMGLQWFFVTVLIETRCWTLHCLRVSCLTKPNYRVCEVRNYKVCLYMCVLFANDARIPVYCELMNVLFANNARIPGLLFTIKTPSYGYENSHYKPETFVRRLRFIMGIPIPIRQCLFSELWLIVSWVKKCVVHKWCKDSSVFWVKECVVRKWY